MTRWRLTVRSADVELRGWMDTDSTSQVGSDELRDLADALRPLGVMVYASPAEPDFDPFGSFR
jgi:hypothetical protein